VEIIHLGVWFLSRIQDPKWNFEEIKVGSNKLRERKLSRRCFTGKHHMLPPCVVLGLIL
jgi:hypothetical protein